MTVAIQPALPVSELKNARPDRFQTSPVTLFMDRFMTRVIQVGGIGVIAAVCAIFLFILIQITPLFQAAKVKVLSTIDLPDGNYVLVGANETGETSFAVQSNGTVLFIDASKRSGFLSITPEIATSKKISTVAYMAQEQELLFGTADGFLAVVGINFTETTQHDKRAIRTGFVERPMNLAGKEGFPIINLSAQSSPDGQVLAAIQDVAGKREVFAVRFMRESGLLGEGTLEFEGTYDLTASIFGDAERVIVGAQGKSVMVANTKGQVFYFREEEDGFKRVQMFSPFEGLEDSAIASIDFLLGGNSLVVTNASGKNRIFSMYIPEGSSGRLYGWTKTFENLPSGATFFDASLRNRAFLIGSGSFVSLRYGTTEAVRWEKKLPFEVKAARIGSKYNRIFLLDSGNHLHTYHLSDPHPEAGLKAFFWPIWYEGYPKPAFEWQSTGFSDEFEPKLSMVPIIFGTLKGTFYALVFSIPLALLAALYTSQFAHPKFRVFVKPTMEIMTSLPSVVLGFLAALWLAPVVETQIPSLLLASVMIPLFAYGFGSFWTGLPIRYRNTVKDGYEWAVLIPLICVVGCLAWLGGPWLENILFVVTDPATGKKIADFRLWWPQATGTPFEQRNSLVVGFMMGFSVIPIIFTIAEDSLSNVPKALRTGSLALGASRWQTAIRVILPTAFPGIFSAIMVGFGRAVGETMIVVMATGNTPIMAMNIFSGMRTLSANIAVELPEAPHLGTLYRTLFLGAMILFVMTFVINTVADVIRQRIREKYRTV